MRDDCALAVGSVAVPAAPAAIKSQDPECPHSPVLQVIALRWPHASLIWLVVVPLSNSAQGLPPSPGLRTQLCIGPGDFVSPQEVLLYPRRGKEWRLLLAMAALPMCAGSGWGQIMGVPACPQVAEKSLGVTQKQDP